ncbi:hypothetical protein D3C72_617930 [compost metagenome]
MFTQNLVNLQAVIQLLPLTVDVEWNRRFFQGLDQRPVTFPSRQHANIKAGIRRLFYQVHCAFAGKNQQRGLPLHIIKAELTIIQGHIGCKVVESGRTFKVLLRFDIAAALHSLLYKLLEIETFHTAVGQVDMGLPLPATAKCIGVNFIAGEIARHRQVTG